MIHLPKRSVTRFFIPLIDVLTLLFCIFLLLPMVKTTGEGSGSAASPVDLRSSDASFARQQAQEAQADPKAPPAEKVAWQRLEQERVAREKQELAQIRQEKMQTLQRRLFIQVLDIDPDTGNLYHQEGQQRLGIGTQEEALLLVARHQRDAGSRELYYLFLYPRRITGYPMERQIKDYERWFQNVAHGTDNPLSAR